MAKGATSMGHSDIGNYVRGNLSYQVSEWEYWVYLQDVSYTHIHHTQLFEKVAFDGMKHMLYCCEETKFYSWEGKCSIINACTVLY